jgi:hypothetical protein
LRVATLHGSPFQPPYEEKSPRNELSTAKFGS